MAQRARTRLPQSCRRFCKTLAKLGHGAWVTGTQTLKKTGKEHKIIMKTLIIYVSQTGFTKKYAQWLAEKTNADLLELKDAKKKEDAFFNEYQAIVFGGWFMAEKVVQIDWFLNKAASWKDKKLAVFAVGASPNEAPVVKKVMENLLTEDQKKNAKAFYCQGGLNYDKMKLSHRLMMKAFASMLKSKKNATEQEKQMAEMVAGSYDISDVKYVLPIVEYLESQEA